MGSKKQRNRVQLQKVYELPEMSEELGAPVFFNVYEDAIKAAEHFGCQVIWGANLENELPIPFPNGEIFVFRNGHWGLQDPNYRCCSCPECLADAERLASQGNKH